ncbi:hypothetical protein HNQ56_002960 [Anaerotaenia torta]|uniref:hypothetical protein n=1 Tax=Anaerotaenia torta TaxID=433293 RepID=UPI003D2454FE
MVIDQSRMPFDPFDIEWVGLCGKSEWIDIHMGLPLTSHDCQVQAIKGSPVCAHMDIDPLRFTALVLRNILLDGTLNSELKKLNEGTVKLN